MWYDEYVLNLQQWIWPGIAPTLLTRANPLGMAKVPSVFAKPTSTSTETTPTKSALCTAEEEEEEVVEEEGPLDTSFVLPSLPNVVLNETPPFTYYEQYCIDEDCFRTGKGCHHRDIGECILRLLSSCSGDFVYLRSDQERPFIARIDRMWTDNE